ncbi:MAG: AAC(3) family N-acetyltransferase [Sphingobacteriaceae bacterium]|nr:AAC(3) family N-acetyltransferase [Sphingobacteriaceae bacterium]
MRAFFRSIAPEFVLRLYKKQKKRRRAQERQKLALQGKVITESDIIEALRQNGLNAGDVAMVHSSLSKLGNVQGGAGTVIRALIEVLGDEGTLMMPSFPSLGFTFDYLSKNPAFDVRHTHSQMGAITEAFRKIKGVKRSMHPTDPVCALGKETKFLLKDHYSQLTPYNQNSPFYKLITLKGKIVLLGTKLDTVTNFHVIEDLIENSKYPVYHKKQFLVKVRDEVGVERMVNTKSHDPAMSKKRRCNELEPAFLKDGVMIRFNIGDASCAIIDAEKMHNWLMEKYKEGITMYTPFGGELE